jgi:hypothetical protein
MLALYRNLLYLYPPAHRREFCEEMMAVFEEAEREAWQKGVTGRVLFCAREVAGVVSGALEEHMRVLGGSDFLQMFGAKFGSGRLRMRSEFRFPKATVALMTIILAAVVWTIEKAKAISASLPHTSTQVGPISVQFTIVPTLLLVLIIAGTAGAIGWAVVFALRRSGIQRFSGFKG